MTQKILIVDDAPASIRLIERIIYKRTIYQVTATGNSLEVPGILEKEEFDLIITDLRMPGLDGMDIIELINRDKRKEKVILCTAFGSMETACKALELGAFDYIEKPFKKERVIKSVEKVMEHQRLRREAESLDLKTAGQSAAHD